MKKFQRVLYGSFKELVDLCAREVINEALSAGCEVVYLDGKKSTKKEVSEALEVGLFDVGNKLLVLEKPASLSALSEVLTQTHMSVLYLCGEVVPKALMGVKKKDSFAKPKGVAKQEKWCAEYVQKLVKDRGKEVSLPICKSIVQRVGSDLGVLRYEAMKLAYVSEGAELTPKEVMSVLAPLSELSGVMLVDAVFSKNPTTFLKVCDRYEKNKKDDPTIGICTGLLFRNIYDLLSVRLCLDIGVTSVQEIADEVGKERWLVEGVLLPRARTYSTKNLREILGHLYVCENLALSGVVSPFSVFKTGLLRLMIS
jgi:DNA polymerase III delta subunit